MNKQKGFSLIELLIVVAIILIIAAIAVPNLLRSRMAANEASSAGAERTIATSNVTYSTSYGVGYAGLLGDMSCPTSGCTGTASSSQADLIDTTLGAATVSTSPKSGYFYTYAPEIATPATNDINNSYTVVSQPASSNVTGVSSFCVDQSNVVRKDPAGGTTTINAAPFSCNADGSTSFAPL
jgi:type IV pilus assembly protein PilA